MSDLFRLHEARWQERQEEGMFATRRLRSFHLDVAARFAEQDLLRLFTLQVNGATVAVQYNFFAHRRTYCYLSGFDPEWKKFSPGAVAVSRSIQHAVGEGCTELDFLRKREAFKYDWGARDRVNRKLLLTHSTALVGEVA
jgi:CelD/BcsL family acetyltransferase involved in cellulose biosynthesis